MGDHRDLTVDVGAYRYNQKRQGLITDVVERLLKLPTRLYEVCGVWNKSRGAASASAAAAHRGVHAPCATDALPTACCKIQSQVLITPIRDLTATCHACLQPSDPDYRLITRKDGTAAGFVTYVEGLLTRSLSRGASLTLNARVVGVDQAAAGGGGFVLRLDGGRTVRAARVLLNLPTKPLLRVLANSQLPGRGRNEQLFAPYPVTAGKVYLYYPQAWWVAQGLTDGEFIDSPIWFPGVEFPFSGRFYDGEVRCPAKGAANASAPTKEFTQDAESTLDLQRCYGYLQVGCLGHPTCCLTHLC